MYKRQSVCTLPIFNDEGDVVRPITYTETALSKVWLYHFMSNQLWNRLDHSTLINHINSNKNQDVTTRDALNFLVRFFDKKLDQCAMVANVSMVVNPLLATIGDLQIRHKWVPHVRRLYRRLKALQTISRLF